MERITEYEVLVEAENATEAADIAIDGGGEYEAEYEWAPQISYTQELDL